MHVIAKTKHKPLSIWKECEDILILCRIECVLRLLTDMSMNMNVFFKIQRGRAEQRGAFVVPEKKDSLQGNFLRAEGEKKVRKPKRKSALWY